MYILMPLKNLHHLFPGNGERGICAKVREWKGDLLVGSFHGVNDEGGMRVE